MFPFESVLLARWQCVVRMVLTSAIVGGWGYFYFLATPKRAAIKMWVTMVWKRGGHKEDSMPSRTIRGVGLNRTLVMEVTKRVTSVQKLDRLGHCHQIWSPSVSTISPTVRWWSGIYSCQFSRSKVPIMEDFLQRFPMGNTVGSF